MKFLCGNIHGKKIKFDNKLYTLVFSEYKTDFSLYAKCSEKAYEFP